MIARSCQKNDDEDVCTRQEREKKRVIELFAKVEKRKKMKQEGSRAEDLKREII